MTPEQLAKVAEANNRGTPNEQPAPLVADAPPMVPEEHEAARLLELLAPLTAWNVCAIPTKGGAPEGTGSYNVRDTDGPKGLKAWIQFKQGNGYNLYLHVAVGPEKTRLSKDDVISLRALFVDLDPVKDGRYDAEMRDTIIPQRIAAYERPPSVVVDSGNGFQCYWLLDEPYSIKGDAARYHEFERSTRRLCEDFDTPDSCFTVDHLLALPGTMKRETGKKLGKGYPPGDRPARIVQWHPERRYKLEDFPAAPPIETSAKSNEGPCPPFDSETDARIAALPDDLRALLTHPDNPDRSAAFWKAMLGLVKAGWSDAMLTAFFMDRRWPIAAHLHDQPNPAAKLAEQIKKARRKVEEHTDHDLADMNASHFVTPIGGKTRVVTLGEDEEFPGRQTVVMVSTTDDFASLHRNRRKIILVDSKPEEVPLGNWWISHKRRRQYTNGIKFMPKHDDDEVGGKYNKWRGFAVRSIKPDGGSGMSGCQLFLDHGRNIICGGNEEHWDYLIKREATIVQKRIRTEVACAYRTEEEGTGKGFWVNTIGRLYGQHYMQIGNPDHILGKHNEHLETLLKVCADEALFARDPHHRNALFGLITEPTMTVEPKFIGAYNAPNHLNIDILSNASHFIPVSGTARRFFVPTVSQERRGDLDYFHAIEVQLHDGGYEALLYHLQHEVDLRDFDVRSVPKTAGLREQASYSRKGIDGLVEKACSEAIVPCRHRRWNDLSFTGDEQGSFDEFIAKHPERDMRDLGALKVKNVLRDTWGCKTGDNGRRKEGRSVVRGIIWPNLEDLRADFEAKHGKQDWLASEATGWLGGSVLTGAEAMAKWGTERTCDDDTAAGTPRMPGSPNRKAAPQPSAQADWPRSQTACRRNWQQSPHNRPENAARGQRHT
jgi:hypothetical protein